MAGIYRRGRTYWARAQRSGREFRESLKTTDRRVAEGRYRTWLERLGATAWGDRPRRLFAEAVTRFITDHLRHLKPSSARRYGISLHWLAEHFAGKFLDQITRERLAEFDGTEEQANQFVDRQCAVALLRRLAPFPAEGWRPKDAADILRRIASGDDPTPRPLLAVPFSAMGAVADWLDSLSTQP